MARGEAARAALDALARDRDGEAGHLLAQEYEARLRRASQPAGADPTGLRALRRRALAAERQRVTAMRREGRIGDDAYHVLEEELDWSEAGLEDDETPPPVPVSQKG